MRGKITFWNRDRRYGFVRNDSGLDTFIHISGVVDGREWLTVGDVVSFEIATDLKTRKLIATQVRVVEPGMAALRRY